MRISTILTPAEIALLTQTDLSGFTAVVFDVLRATSTFTTALSHGTIGIYPAQDIAEAQSLKDIHPHALLGGERHGEKISGFDLGNSPLEYRDRAGREIISTTTNGTLALRAVAQARVVIAGALLNIQAIADFLRLQAPENLLLVCAGTGKDFAIEDGLGAGALLAALPTCPTDDAAKMLLALWHTHSKDLFSALAHSKNGQRLIARGRRAEVEWCAQLDGCQTFGILIDGKLQPAPIVTSGISPSTVAS
jgi:2-phosphosulfolactate phosphatase